MSNKPKKVRKKRITSPTDLPSNVRLVMYSPPFFSLTKKDKEKDETFAVRCSVHEFKQKYNKEPKMVYLFRDSIFIELEE